MKSLKTLRLSQRVAYGRLRKPPKHRSSVKHIQTDKAAIATGVWAGDTYYLSGQLASPITPADAAKGTPADYGDTKAQAASIFAKDPGRSSRSRAST